MTNDELRAELARCQERISQLEQSNELLRTAANAALDAKLKLEQAKLTLERLLEACAARREAA